MKLTALGIDSKDFDRERYLALWEDITTLEEWLWKPTRMSASRKSLCESASLLDKLVTMKIHSSYYRGLKFAKPSWADDLLGGRTSSKYPCESWTPSLETAEEFVTKGSLRHAVRFIMARQFSKNEIILDLGGLRNVMESLGKDLKEAEKRRELTIERPREFKKFLGSVEELKESIDALGESEFLMHPMPYSPKDIHMVKIDSYFDGRIPSQMPILAGVLSQVSQEHSFDELTGRWLHMKAGQIVRVE